VLQTQNAKLERIYETDSKRHQEQASSDKQRIEALIKQTSQFEIQLSVAQKSQLESSKCSCYLHLLSLTPGAERELERAADREKASKLKVGTIYLE